VSARRAVAGVVLGLVLGGVGGAGWQLLHVPDVPGGPAVVQQEDSPGWDCATAGNGLCGPGPTGGRQ